MIHRSYINGRIVCQPSKIAEFGESSYLWNYVTCGDCVRIAIEHHGAAPGLKRLAEKMGIVAKKTGQTWAVKRANRLALKK